MGLKPKILFLLIQSRGHVGGPSRFTEPIITFVRSSKEHVVLTIEQPLGPATEFNPNIQMEPRTSHGFEQLNEREYHLTLQTHVGSQIISGEALGEDVHFGIGQILEKHRVSAIFSGFEPFFFHLHSKFELPFIYFPHGSLLAIQLSLMEQPYFDFTFKTEERPNHMDWFLIRNELLAVKKSSFIVYQHEKMKQDLERFYHVGNKALYPLKQAVDKVFWRCEGEWEANRSAAFIGRLEHQKGVYHLLQDFPEPYKLTVVGQQSWSPALSKSGALKYNELVADKATFWHPWLSSEEIKEKLKNVTFILIPSHHELGPLVLHETMAMGKIPIVQAGSGGPEEFVQNGINGFIRDFAVKPWHLIIEELFQQEIDLASISKRARETVRDWQEWIEDLSRVVGSIQQELQK